jgi:hypothetical protein
MYLNCAEPTYPEIDPATLTHIYSEDVAYYASPDRMVWTREIAEDSDDVIGAPEPLICADTNEQYTVLQLFRSIMNNR